MKQLRVLFVCTKNAVRSPMAKAIAVHLLANGDIRPIHVDSAGVDPSDVDGFAIASMAERGLDIQNHESKELSDFDIDDFDVLVTLSNTAATYAKKHFGLSAAEIETWDVSDPCLVEGNRDQRLAAYRDVGLILERYIRQRFAP